MLSASYMEMLDRDHPSPEENAAALQAIIASDDKSEMAWVFVCRNSRFMYAVLKEFLPPQSIDDDVFTNALIAFRVAVMKLKAVTWQTYCGKYIKWRVIKHISIGRTQLSKGLAPYRCRFATSEFSINSDPVNGPVFAETLSDPTMDTGHQMKQVDGKFLSDVLKLVGTGDWEDRKCNEFTTNQKHIIGILVRNGCDENQACRESHISKGMMQYFKKSIRRKLEGHLRHVSPSVRRDFYNMIGVS